MGLTYFKRYRMECDLDRELPELPPLPTAYELIAWRPDLLRAHAEAKFASFCCEMDANVFPCLGQREGCLRLMREITRRPSFIPEATWLLVHHPEPSTTVPCGTVQGLHGEGWGAIQNLGVAPAHRGKGLGTYLLVSAAKGFRLAGLRRMHLEVTTANSAAVRLYERLGFRRARTVFKVAEVVGA
jgi:ribosomal protein S18 acetylase RimI-like enzyme